MLHFNSYAIVRVTIKSHFIFHFCHRIERTIKIGEQIDVRKADNLSALDNVLDIMKVVNVNPNVTNI